MKSILSACLVLLAFLSIRATVSKSSSDKEQLNSSEITSITIYKWGYETSETKGILKYLKKDQIKDFVDKWNKTKNMEARKYIPTYMINVYFKDNSIRKFRANGQYLKEKNDLCADFKNKGYFEQLYSKARLDKE